MTALIIIPALNESASIGEVIRSIREVCGNDILVVDDCSEDNTGEIVLENHADLITLPYNLGAWGAIQTGMRYALFKGYASILTMDGDNQHRPEHIPELLGLIAGGNDIVIGSCLSRGSIVKQVAWPLLRKLAGIDIEDFTSGFRAYNRKAMELLLTNESFFLDYQDIGVLLLCKRKKLKITEIPVGMNQRENGKSRIFTNVRLIIKYFISTLFLIGTKRW